MSKKMLKRSLALGALMAFVITGSAMSVAEATYYAQAKGEDVVYSDIVSGEEAKQRVLGGWDNPDRSKDTNAMDTLNSKLTVTGGNWNGVVGGHWIRDLKTSDELQVNVESTNTLIKDATVRMAVGGAVAVNYQTLDYNGNGIYNLKIESGTFGHKGYEVGANVPELFVAGGDLIKYSTSWSAIDDKKLAVSIKSTVKETNVEILDGTFDAAIIGGSVAMAYYDPANKATLEANVSKANTLINGGTFNHAIIAGGFAWGQDALSKVDTANLEISGTSGKLLINDNIYAGGMRNEKNALGTATVGVTNISIDDAEVKDIYGTGAILRNLASGNDSEWEYVQNADAIVNTTLKLTNVTAGDVVIPEGSVTLRVEDDENTKGEINIGQTKDKTGLTVTKDGENKVTVSVEANGEVNDAYAGDYKKMVEERFKVKGYNLLEKNEETGETSLNVDAMTVEEGEVMGAATLNSDGTITTTANQGNTGIKDIVATGLISWRYEMNDMNKRMGELRNANGEHGVWVRMVRGETEYNSVKNQYNQYQLGYDEKLSVDPSWTVGVALSYTEADNNFSKGTGESTNKALSIYGSKLNDDGTFIDLIAKYARLENDFDLGTAKGDYDTNGYSFSAEYGKRIQQGNGLWIEPQVELTYGQVDGATYMVGGRTVNQDNMESLIGRVGFSLGKDISKGNVYARASYLYDFEGETSATFSKGIATDSFEQDLGGGWWEVGVGANINLSKATYIYADIEKTFGGEVDTNWQWNLGVRYSF